MINFNKNKIKFYYFRKLENEINKFQAQLRKIIHKKQMNIYEEIGNEKLEDFYEKYDNEFQRVNYLSCINSFFFLNIYFQS